VTVSHIKRLTVLGGIVLLCALAGASPGAAKAKPKQNPTPPKQTAGKSHAVAPAPPAELSFRRQAPSGLDGTVGVSQAPVLGISRRPKPEPAGVVSDSSGNLAKVTVSEGKLSIAPVSSGKYTGTVTLNPFEGTPAKTKLTFEVRDYWLFPLIALICGLLLALLSELWLTRLRPRGQLKKRMDRLALLIAATVTQVSGRLAAIEKVTWRVPRLDGDESLLATAQQKLEAGLAGAMSDGERERFGPDGKEMEKVDTLVETYEELLGYATQIAQAFVVLRAPLPGELREDLDGGAVAARISELLDGSVIATTAGLSARAIEAKDLYTVLLSIARLDRAYRLLAANPGIKKTCGEEVASQRRQLLGSMATTADGESQHTRYVELSNKVYKREPGNLVQLTMRAPSLALEGSDIPSEGLSAGPLLGPMPPPAAPVLYASTGGGNVRSRYLNFGNWAFIVISAAVVVGSGMQALYFTNETFGSLSDYLGILLWGSAVQGGISLVRRLVPGLAKELVGTGS
jgi:hypothetical protein